MSRDDGQVDSQNSSQFPERSHEHLGGKVPVRKRVEKLPTTCPHGSQVLGQFRTHRQVLKFGGEEPADLDH